VYEAEVDNQRPKRIIPNAAQRNEYATYNLICKAEDTVLISKPDRRQYIPSAKTGRGGYGRHSRWYAGQEKDRAAKHMLLDYVDDLLAAFVPNFVPNDERKYDLHDEHQQKIITAKQMRRSREARDKCIKLHGCKCGICGFEFERVYGAIGKDFIEVHHITPIGELATAAEYVGTDPAKDLIPLCSNCHSMVHRKNPPYPPNDLKAIIHR
jgi:5-methylcytosine-specific restriction protein A